MLDSPTNNFCTLNPLDKSGGTLAEGNTKFTHSGSHIAVGSTIGMDSGKWYFECYVVSESSDPAVGIMGSEAEIADQLNSTPSRWYRASGQKFTDSVSSSYGATWTTGDIIGVEVDIDTGTIEFYKNNVSQGVAFTDLSSAGIWLPTIKVYTASMVANFGQDSSFAGNKTAQSNTDDNGYGDFYYSPPTGYLALCTQNLDDPAVIPSEHFNTVLYTGDGTSSHAITGVGFQPDFNWIKPRSIADHHRLNDAVRGVNKTLISNGTNAESTSSNNYLDSFDSDGFTIGSSDGGWNGSGTTYVAWNWKANGSDVLNENGTLDSQVSANQDAGFSIASFDLTSESGLETIGHGLSKPPELIILKARTFTYNWSIYHESIGNTKRMIFTTSAEQTYSDAWGDTSPTSSVFTLGDVAFHGAGTQIAYCFHSVEGYSKVGSYTGNGSADGTFVYTGFRPAYVMWKRTDSTGAWIIHNNETEPYNPNDTELSANSSNTEGGGGTIDFTSNGFKHRGVDSPHSNASGGSYIYIAFAEYPFKYTNAR